MTRTDRLLKQVVETIERERASLDVDDAIQQCRIVVKFNSAGVIRASWLERQGEPLLTGAMRA